MNPKSRHPTEMETGNLLDRKNVDSCSIAKAIDSVGAYIFQSLEFRYVHLQLHAFIALRSGLDQEVVDCKVMDGKDNVYGVYKVQLKYN